MAKRLRDTKLNEELWYKVMPPEYKCLWEYINAECDLYGIWDVDIDVAQFMIDRNKTTNPIVLERAIEFLKYQIIETDGGKKWFIADFIKTQYGSKLSNNNFHLSVIKKLRSYNIDLNKCGISYSPIKSLKVENKYPNKQISDYRWKKKRLSVLDRDNYMCCSCSSGELLNVHHKFYIDGRKIWEYDDADLITLCRECHTLEHHIITGRKKKEESLI